MPAMVIFSWRRMQVDFIVMQEASDALSKLQQNKFCLIKVCYFQHNRCLKRPIIQKILVRLIYTKQQAELCNFKLMVR